MAPSSNAASPPAAPTAAGVRPALAAGLAAARAAHQAAVKMGVSGRADDIGLPAGQRQLAADLDAGVFSNAIRLATEAIALLDAAPGDGCAQTLAAGERARFVARIRELEGQVDDLTRTNTALLANRQRAASLLARFTAGAWLFDALLAESPALPAGETRPLAEAFSRARRDAAPELTHADRSVYANMERVIKAAGARIRAARRAA